MDGVRRNTPLDWALTAVAVLLLAWAALPEPQGVATCPKVEYREVLKRGRIVRDTVTIIPDGCR